MKNKFLSFLLIVGALTACQQKELETTNKTVDEHTFEMLQTIPDSEAQLKFAKILSKAVYDDEDIRSFIQKEALKQFDCDYDILYGKVKNKEVKDGLTFKQALDAYAENENTLDQIEKSAPLINILLPDLEFVGGMSAKKWDISNNCIGVVPDLGNKNNTVFTNGDSVSYIPHNEFPVFPLLVIKNSERMVLRSPMTKSSEAQYDFKYNQYNPSLNRKTKREWTEPTNQANKSWTLYDEYLYLSEDRIEKELIKAYNENDNQLCQREYLYYNLDKQHRFFKPESINPKIRERMYALKITLEGLYYLSNKNEIDDPSINGMKGTDIGMNDRITVRGGSYRGMKLYDKLWKGGTYDIKINISRLVGDVVKSESNSIFPIRIRDAFDISNVDIDRLHPTAFRHSREYYTVRPEYIKSKWIELDATKYLEYWNPFAGSKNILIKAFEQDKGKSYKTTFKYDFTVSSKYDASYENKVKKDDSERNINTAYQLNTTKSISKEIEISYTDGSDNIGEEGLDFQDNVIVVDKKQASVRSIDGKKYYPINHVEIGKILKIAFVPMRTNRTRNYNNPENKNGTTVNKRPQTLPSIFKKPGSKIHNTNNTGMCTPNGKPKYLTAPGEQPYICKINPTINQQ